MEDFAHAEEEVRKAEADLLLLDIILPGSNGQEILRNLRKTSDIPVLMLNQQNRGNGRNSGYELRGGRLHDKTV